MNMQDGNDPASKNGGTSGKIVVAVMLLVGITLAFILSRYMPRRNPKLAEPGSPYYSPPDIEDLKPRTK